MDRSRIPLMAALVVSVMLAAETVSAQQNTAAQQPPAQNTNKVAILVHSYPSAMGGDAVEHMYSAMSDALLLKKAGVEVEVIFYQAGLKWIPFLMTGAVEAEKLPAGTWNPSEDEKGKIVAMLINSMNSESVTPEEKAKVCRMLVETIIATQRAPQKSWTPSPEESAKVLNEWEKLRKAGVTLTVPPKKMAKELAMGKVGKAKTSEQGGLDLAAYVRGGYQVWLY